ncbi:hypothetical protein DRW03_32725 [Corallococcus sp. H22C18031201]|uniref:hypothetical protein n=1 Tax=Citreicoccus inhibens TaxID=2849499 RepID=UPI000E7567D9|nr:hypothetical protein [Citreicoccus inhibens]MBU8897953.1 hypothetical protein [Citreicoccus inhibens]RJS15842.1 hypothetical protein DRW03_32725 [Corallococcus sp. H22C18031201]
MKVVGHRSTGTNGDVTLLLLPERVNTWSTGMEILFPDFEAAPTVVDLATGRDAELLRVIEVLRTGN